MTRILTHGAELAEVDEALLPPVRRECLRPVQHHLQLGQADGVSGHEGEAGRLLAPLDARHALLLRGHVLQAGSRLGLHLNQRLRLVQLDKGTGSGIAATAMAWMSRKGQHGRMIGVTRWMQCGMPRW